MLAESPGALFRSIVTKEMKQPADSRSARQGPPRREGWTYARGCRDRPRERRGLVSA
jgi:hypothetical protein